MYRFFSLVSTQAWTVCSKIDWAIDNFPWVIMSVANRDHQERVYSSSRFISVQMVLMRCCYWQWNRSFSMNLHLDSHESSCTAELFPYLLIIIKSKSKTQVTLQTFLSPCRLGFLGLLHMEVFNQRLEQEYNASVIVTAPTVPYKCILSSAKLIKVTAVFAL